MSTFNQNNDTQLTNLIVNYLPQNMTDKELFSMFVTIGPVESCRVMKDNKTGYSFGFGFVNYSRKEDAARAISSLNGLQVQNKRLKVSYARPSGEDIKETNLYVTNLPRTITEEQVEFMFSKFGRIVQKNLLKDKVTGMPRGVAFVRTITEEQVEFMFSKFGRIVQKNLLTDKVTGMPRGVAFVRYDRREEALEAIERMNGTVPDGSQDPITVKIAEEHGKQKAAYYAGFHAGYNQSRGGGAAGKKPGTATTPNRGGYNARSNQAANYNSPLYSAYQPVLPNHRNLAGNFGGAVRQDKSHYRFNPVAFNTGYNVGGGYY